jgi:methionyl-tRNA formyltransferase
MPTEVVVLGKGSLARQGAQWFLDSPDHALSAVVPCMPEPTWTESLTEWAHDAGVPIVPSGDFCDLPVLRDGGRVDLVVSIFYDKIIPAAAIDACGRILNLHNGPLPRYRGVSPINWALKNGERSHGVTIHEVTPGIDDGPIVAQCTYSIYPEIDEVEDVYRRALHYGWSLFQETMPILDRIEAVPQDESQALYYSKQDDHRLGDRRDFTRAASVAA